MAFSSWRTFVTGEVVTAAHMNQEIRDNGNALFPDEDTTDTWTVLLEATTTNPTGSWEGFQYQIGGMMNIWFRGVLSGNGSGVFFLTLPVAAVNIAATTALGSGSVVGKWHARDDSAGASAGGEVLLASSTTIRFELPHFSGGQRSVDNDTPWVWASGDVLTVQATYPVA